MMHRDTIEIWHAVLPCQVLSAYVTVSPYRVRQGASSPTLNFGTPSLSRKLIELRS